MNEDFAPAVPSFPPEEYAERIRLAREAMQRADLDVMLLSSEHNFRYFTGDISSSPFQITRPKFFVLPVHAEPCVVVANGSAPGLVLTTWLRDIRTWPAPRPEDDGVSLVAEVIREAVSGHGRVGVELGPESRLGFPVGDFLRLRKMLEPVSFVDAEQPVLRRLRMIKSLREIENVRRICGVVSTAYENLPELLVLGDTEWTACRKFQMEVLRLGATQAPKITGISGRHGYDRSNPGPTNRRLERGDLLSIDTGCQFDYYWSDFCRHYSFGPPSSTTVRAYDALYRATDAGIAESRPGRRTSEVWRAMADVLSEEGFDTTSKVGRMGHGMGLFMPEPPSINPTDDTEIETGMVLNIEPSVAYIAPEDGARKIMIHEENIAVTDGDPMLLSHRAPATIPVIDA